MGIDQELQETANRLARQFKQKIPGLEKEIQSLEKQKAAVVSKLESARRSKDLAAQYHIYINEWERRCPLCWVTRGGNTKILRAIEGDGSVDRFKCEGCGSPFTDRA